LAPRTPSQIAYHERNRDRINAERREQTKTEEFRVKRQAYQDANRERITAAQREWVINNKDRAKNRELLRLYNITLIEYNELRELQNFRCAICRKHESEFSKGLFVDHDHGCCPGDKSCGYCVRGLLCNGCNRGVGFLGDDPATVQQALEYLTETAANHYTAIAPKDEAKVPFR